MLIPLARFLGLPANPAHDAIRDAQAFGGGLLLINPGLEHS